MIKIVLASVACGGLFGYFTGSESFLSASEYIIIGGLSLLLFFVGFDIGIAGTAAKNIRKAGLRVFAFPAATIAGTLAGTALVSFFIGLRPGDAMAVGSGFGWYTLAPFIIEPYSQELSAMSFLYNVMREMAGVITIPIVAKYVGYVETTCLPGAAAMDVCMPVVEKSTNGETAIYSFVSGVVLSAAVPVLVPLFIGI